MSEFWPVSSLENNTVGKTISSLTDSIHMPHNTAIDHDMSAPPSSSTQCTSTAKEEEILIHIALAEKNRAVLSQNGPNHQTTLPQFTPTPIGSFPEIHMFHSAQIFDYLDNKVLLAWLQVVHPKLLVRVFDCFRKDIAEKPAVIAEYIHTNIVIIVNFVYQDTIPICISLPHSHKVGKEPKTVHPAFSYTRSPKEPKNYP
jgi:hypothetical protein